MLLALQYLEYFAIIGPIPQLLVICVIQCGWHIRDGKQHQHGFFVQDEL